MWILCVCNIKIILSALPYILTSSLDPLFRPYFSLQSDYVLSSLYHSRNLLKKLGKEEARRPNLNIVDDWQRVVIGSRSVTLSGIGVMFHKLLDEIKERWKDLLMGIDLEKLIKIPETLFDEPDNAAPGFYFGHDPRNDLQQYEETLGRVILGTPQLREKYCTISGDVVNLNYQMCLKFLQETAAIRSALGTLLHIITSGPWRGTEYSIACIRNTVHGNPRNVKAIAGKLCLVSGYNKTSFAVGPLSVCLQLLHY
jgi:hypothetical protein